MKVVKKGNIIMNLRLTGKVAIVTGGSVSEFKA